MSTADQDRVQRVFNKLNKLLIGKKNAAYQFITLEALLREIEEQPKRSKVALKDIFFRFADIAYVLRRKYKLDLGGDKQSIEGKTSANGIIDRFVEKYNLKDINQLNPEQIEGLRNAMMASNIRRWPIEGITNEKIGLFRKQNIEGQDYIVIEEEIKQVILKYIGQVREQNNDAITKYLKTIPSNSIHGRLSISRDIGIEEIDVINTQVNEEQPMKVYKEDELIKNIHAYIKGKGFTYPVQTIQNIYLSLKTKPFTILAGISGTGKSKMIELFAEAIGATVENGRYKLIAVRPDWCDSTELLGYRDLNNRFNPGILTQIIKEAIKYQDQPYFVCLDEMNLARVEYYLSDFLSIIESRKWRGDCIVTYPLLEESMFGKDEEAKIQYGQLYLPENLYIVGTVNMDETTYSFSKKVLDRANTIEFSKVNLMDGLEKVEVMQVAPLEHVTNGYIRSDYLTLIDCKVYKKEVERVIRELEILNKILEGSQMHFAYRVRNEIVFYMLYNYRFGLMSYEEAFELQILQKILPRITGSSQKVGKVLQGLYTYATGRYPKVCEKIQFMIERYEEDEFTSYWM